MFSTPIKPMTIQNILDKLACELTSYLTIQQLTIDGLKHPEPSDFSYLLKGGVKIEDLTAHHIACVHNKKYLSHLGNLTHGVCIIAPSLLDYLPAHAPANTKEDVNPSLLIISHPKPYRLFAAMLQILYQRPAPLPSIHPSAIIASTAQVDPTCFIGPNVVIEDGVVIGASTIIQGHCFIHANVRLGQECVIEPFVTLSSCVIGDKAYIKTGAKIGQQGFGFDMDDHGPIDVPQLGQVIIGHNVCIGANTTIDRGSLSDTVIGNYCRIDNLVQIAHNVVLGDGCIIVAQVGIAGSTQLGSFVQVAGQVGIAGHLTIGDQVRIAGQSGVMRSLKAKAVVAGYPAVPINDWHKQTILLKYLSIGRK